jgi:glycogen operon protein
MIMDSLRYWVLEMHVDGFRFDLAATLARQFHEVDRLSAFFDLVQQDPVVSQVKLIAEPWDLGDGGYQVGGFPPLWTEWNGRFRDTVRDFWRGATGDVRDLGYRLSGSSDLYDWGGRRPYASVNYVTAHDGFTLRDLVSYNHKHNAANGEDGRDGSDDNRSWNCGTEGETDDPAVAALRRRQLRNLLGTLLLSTGVPMLVAGDEMGRTQGGNNNAYCQDNATSWVDWSLLEDPGWRSLRDLAARLIALRRAHPVLRRGGFFSGLALAPEGLRDVAWFRPDGREMTEGDWFAQSSTLGMFLSGRDIPQRDARGGRVVDDSFLLLAHGGHRPVSFVLPGAPWAAGYALLLDTAREQAWLGPAHGEPAEADAARVPEVPGGARLSVPGRSLRLYRVRETR